MDRETVKDYRRGERGSARVKFFLVILVLVVLGNAAINYIPVAYQGESFKQEMQTIVVQGMALPTNGASPVDVMKAKITRAAKDNQLPPALIDIKNTNNVTTAHVKYSKEVSIVPFGIYNYNYEFDHTATPTGFLMKN
jgi:hypothetical protein